jgi:CRP-like cAMP-binding protein
MGSQAFISRLVGLDLFRDFAPADLQQLLTVCSDVSVPSGTVIFEAGRTGRVLYILTSGTVAIELVSDELGETTLAELEAVSVFGESSFFHDAPHSASAIATSDCTLVQLTRPAYDELTKTSPLVAYHLGANAADILGSRLQQADQTIAELLQEQQDARVAARWREYRRRIAHGFSSGRGGGGGFAPGGLS